MLSVRRVQLHTDNAALPKAEFVLSCGMPHAFWFLLGGVKISHDTQSDAGCFLQIISGNRFLTQSQASMCRETHDAKTQIHMKSTWVFRERSSFQRGVKNEDHCQCTLRDNTNHVWFSLYIYSDVLYVLEKHLYPANNIQEEDSSVLGENLANVMRKCNFFATVRHQGDKPVCAHVKSVNKRTITRDKIVSFYRQRITYISFVLQCNSWIKARLGCKPCI